MIVNPGIRRFLGSAIQRLFNGASFSAPLTHSAIPTRAASGTTATFTRATTATVRDNEGVLRTAIAGEARFEGARRVKNLLATNSENATTDSPLALNASATATVITTTAAGNSYYYKLSNVAIPALGKAIVQLELSGSGSVNITVQPSVSGAGFVKVNLNVVLTSTPTFYDIVVTNNATAQAFYFGIDGRVSEGANAASQLAGTVTVTKWMIEDVTGRADQTTPSEYVSVGVESAPYYHGSFVDGVKCFPTDLSGNPIPAATMLGYQAEGARTNLCLQSNAFTTTWLATGTPAATQNVVGPDGATSAWTLTDNAAGATESIYQGIALTAAAYTGSVFVAKTVGAQSSYPVIFFYPADGTQVQAATVDTTNGVITDWTSADASTMASGRSVRIVSYNDDFWRVELTKTGTAANHFFQFFPAGTTSATYAGPTIDSAAQGSAVFANAQVELGSFASSPIATTTAAVTRNADVLTYSSAGNILGTAGWSYAELRMPTSTGGNAYVMDVGSNRPTMFIDSLGTDSLYDGTATRLFGTYTFGTQSKICNTWEGAASAGAIGGAVTTYGFDGDLNTGAAISIGCSNASASHVFGTIRNVRIGQRQLSSSELGAITA